MHNKRLKVRQRGLHPYYMNVLKLCYIAKILAIPYDNLNETGEYKQDES
jgi:hypothetical protein